MRNVKTKLSSESRLGCGSSRYAIHASIMPYFACHKETDVGTQPALH